jgi:hypothetical protein
MKEFVVEWSNSNKIACADNSVNDWFSAETHFTDSGETIKVSTQIQLNKMRLENLLGNIKITKFIYEGKELEINNLGDVGEWPKGFSDINFGITCMILKTANKLRKEARGE